MRLLVPAFSIVLVGCVSDTPVGSDSGTDAFVPMDGSTPTDSGADQSSSPCPTGAVFCELFDQSATIPPMGWTLETSMFANEAVSSVGSTVTMPYGMRVKADALAAAGPANSRILRYENASLQKANLAYSAHVRVEHRGASTNPIVFLAMAFDPTDAIFVFVDPNGKAKAGTFGGMFGSVPLPEKTWTAVEIRAACGATMCTPTVLVGGTPVNGLPMISKVNATGLRLSAGVVVYGPNDPVEVHYDNVILTAN